MIIGGRSKNNPKCYTTHEVLKFGKGRLLGASCGHPRSGYDIYIGFSMGMEFKYNSYPWVADDSPVIEFQFLISDMSVPKSPKDFKKMIKWVCNQLHAGKKIHVGCFGGHGRTGLFIAAVRAEFDGDKDAGNWVRKNHCIQAIESQSQINFLFKHFGIKKIKSSKTNYRGWIEKGNKVDKLGSGIHAQNVIPFKLKGPQTLKHVSGKGGSIWG